MCVKTPREVDRPNPLSNRTETDRSEVSTPIQAQGRSQSDGTVSKKRARAPLEKILEWG